MPNKPTVIYVTRDIERALGMKPCATYQIITNKTPYSESIKVKHSDFVHLIDSSNTKKSEKVNTAVNESDLLDTWELLEHEVTKVLLANLQSPISILVFKNTSKIEEICKNNNWTLLNPSSLLAEKIENKMTQVEYLGQLADKYLPKHSLTTTKEITWDKKPIIIQWAHSHTGQGTILVNNIEELKSVQVKFPDRLARISPYIHGPSFTLNIAVDPKKTFIGNISYQITGIPPFTENIFSTIGNDWSLTHSLLNEIEISQIETMANEIGEKLRLDGWKGLFGIDIMRDDEHDKIYLIEINARQPASTSYESQLQIKNREFGVQGITIFEAHLIALSNQNSISKLQATRSKIQTPASKLLHPIIPINDGSQIIERKTKENKYFSKEKVTRLEDAGYKVINYDNTELNSDILRIQSAMGIMETHGKFNKRGKELLKILEVNLVQ